MKAILSVLTFFTLLISSIAVAHTDGIYNRSANSVGDTQGIDSNVATSAPAFSLAGTGAVTDTVGGTTITYASVPIGVANVNRVVAVGIAGDTTGASQVISGVTIGGVTAVQAANAVATNGISFSDIWYAPVPTGTTASVVVTYTIATSASVVEAYRIITTTPIPLAGAGVSNSVLAQSLANTPYVVPAGGGSFNIYVFRGGSLGNSVVTWTNASPTTNGDNLQDGIGGGTNSNPIVSVAHTTATGSVTVSASIAGPGFNNNQTISAAAWGP